MVSTLNNFRDAMVTRRVKIVIKKISGCLRNGKSIVKKFKEILENPNLHTILLTPLILCVLILYVSANCGAFIVLNLWQGSYKSSSLALNFFKFICIKCNRDQQ